MLTLKRRRGTGVPRDNGGSAESAEDASMFTYSDPSILLRRLPPTDKDPRPAGGLPTDAGKSADGAAREGPLPSSVSSLLAPSLCSLATALAK